MPFRRVLSGTKTRYSNHYSNSRLLAGIGDRQPVDGHADGILGDVVAHVAVDAERDAVRVRLVFVVRAGTGIDVIGVAIELAVAIVAIDTFVIGLRVAGNLARKVSLAIVVYDEIVR